MGRELVNERECKNTYKMTAINHCLFRFWSWIRVAGKYILLYNKYIVLFRSIIYVLYSLIHTFSTFYVGLLFTHTLVGLRVNILSNYHTAGRKKVCLTLKSIFPSVDGCDVLWHDVLSMNMVKKEKNKARFSVHNFFFRYWRKTSVDIRVLHWTYP